MQKSNWLILPLILLILVVLACDGSREINSTSEPNSQVSSPALINVSPKGQRILELDANAPENENYDSAMDLARELGAESIRLSVYWDDIEIKPGVYNPDPNWLAIANQYYSSQGLAISLTISVLDTTEVRLPDDLDGKSFSDPEILIRFKGLLGYIKTQLVDVDLIYLAIGNEIDGVLGNDPAAWKEYRDFFEPAAESARELWPDLPISTKVTYDGFTGSMMETSRDMYRNSDVVMTTYYPLNGDITVKDPDVILKDFQILADLFPKKEILMTEIGYPTSAENNSSPEKQAKFIHYMFQAWDEHSGQITVLSYSWLSDLPESSVRELESYYGLNDQRFGEFLRTLGIRTYPGAGEDKIGFGTFLTETNARGW